MAAAAAAANPSLFTIIFFFIVFLSISGISSNAHNITEILSPYPDFSLHNSLLSQTKLADDINAHQTITCLVLSNAAISPLSSNRSLSDLKDSLSLLVLLDYLDSQKLHSLPKYTTFTTLFQATGRAQQDQGLVNISNIGDQIGFASAAPGSNVTAFYVRSIKEIPFNISVVQISAPIIAPSLLPSPPMNITDLLLGSGCRIFADLIVRTGVLTDFESGFDTGITVFAPLDQAFAAHGVPDPRKMNDSVLVPLLKYHALSSYDPITTLRSEEGPIRTMAGYDLRARAEGGSVILSAGAGTSRIASTVADSAPVCIFAVEGVLLPAEIFGMSSPPAPSPKPSSGPASSPAPSPAAGRAPSPVEETSPPAPPTPPTPPSAPTPMAESPEDSSDGGDSGTEKSAGGDGKAATFAKALGIVCFVGVLYAFS